MLEVSVIIPTFRRPDLLRAAVESVLAQRSGIDRAEIVVVDNDPDRSAEGLVLDLARSASGRMRYVNEPRAGISHARNAGIAATAAPYVAFLDDDEVANPEWLSSLLSTARRHDADIVVGPVRPLFPDGVLVPSYAIGMYWREAKAETGDPIEWSGIGNALLRRDRCLGPSVPFDPRFGLSGGEDSVFLGRLRERGRRLVWCAEAAVTEAIPVEKLAPAYLLRRAFRTGQTTGYYPRTLARPRWSGVLRWMVIGAIQFSLYLPWSIALRISGREEWLAAMGKAASGLGKILWHPSLHIRNYRLGA